jgi:hypothetical protein
MAREFSVCFWPSVVEIEPANHGADVERRHDGIELVGGPRNPRAPGQSGAGHDRAEQLRAGGIAQSEDAAAERIHETEPCDSARFRAVGREMQHVVGDFSQQRVGRWTLRIAATEKTHRANPRRDQRHPQYSSCTVRERRTQHRRLVGPNLRRNTIPRIIAP